jgi:hypothetical protein
MVRMQRVGMWLLVEDNQQCGGSMSPLLASTGATSPGRTPQDEAGKAQLSQR